MVSILCGAILSDGLISWQELPKSEILGVLERYILTKLLVRLKFSSQKMKFKSDIKQRDSLKVK